MFIRKRTHNRSLAGFMLVAFLLASTFGQTSELVTSCFKSLESDDKKSKSASVPAGQAPCEKTEKEEKNSEEKTAFISVQIDATLFTERERDKHSFHCVAPCPDESAGMPLYIFIRTLRL